MAQRTVQHTLIADVPRLDALVAQVCGVSRAIARGMFDNGCVQLGGKPATECAQAASAGAQLTVRFDPQTRYREKTRPRPSAGFRIAFEDAHLIVVEKEAGLLTVPTNRHEQNTLVHHIARYLSGSQRITHLAHIVHRLDRDTSGLLVFAKSAEIASALKDQFAAHKPDREYAAIVASTLREDHGTFRSFLATDEDLDQYSTATPGEGKLAVTHYQVRERLRGATFVRVRLETGRRNQIRVHFSEQGHPILGDVRYRPEQARHPLWPANRLALHALTLGLIHPLTGKPVTCTSELPAVFSKFVAATRLQR